MDNKLARVPLPMENHVHPHLEQPVPTTTGAEAAPTSSDQAPSAPVEALQEQIVAVLRTCHDPEIPVNIYELGLIYNVDVEEDGAVKIRMTLTSPACPAAGSLPPEVQAKVRAIPGVTRADLEVVFDPPWTPERMSEAARVQLGFF